VQFTIRGYSDKQHVLLQKLMDKMMSLEIDDKRFEILLERVSYVRYFFEIVFVHCAVDE